MLLSGLCVIHEPKPSVALVVPDTQTGSFFLETCQRRLWVGQELGAGLRGEAAYLQLLLVSCGLESELAGETDVFGQLKDAWRAFEAASPREARRLLPVMQRLFEDTKEIRARHLEGLGGVSYGSAVRKLLDPQPTDRILIVGAGRLARAVAPFFLDSELVLLNRSKAGAVALAGELAAQGARRVTVVENPEAEARAWREARHAVICVPATTLEGERAELWRRGGSSGLVIHLGCLNTGDAESWRGVPGLRTLADIFALRTSQDEARLTAVRAARAACRERARLRDMGASLSIAHGWEDLAAFTQ